MKAVSYTRHGPAADVLEYGELPDPDPAPGEVLIRVCASGVNPSDVKARAGFLWPMTAPRTIPHSDGAGIIEAVGDGVDSTRVGQRVWTYNVNRTENGLGQGAIGTAAELVAVRDCLAVPLPDGIDFAPAAALGVPAMTAHAALLTDGLVEGMTVLVTGGAGGGGSREGRVRRTPRDPRNRGCAGSRELYLPTPDHEARRTRKRYRCGCAQGHWPIVLRRAGSLLSGEQYRAGNPAR